MPVGSPTIEGYVGLAALRFCIRVSMLKEPDPAKTKSRKTKQKRIAASPH
jgi:hypothetical protein